MTSPPSSSSSPRRASQGRTLGGRRGATSSSQRLCLPPSTSPATSSPKSSRSGWRPSRHASSHRSALRRSCDRCSWRTTPPRDPSTPLDATRRAHRGRSHRSRRRRRRRTLGFCRSRARRNRRPKRIPSTLSNSRINHSLSSSPPAFYACRHLQQRQRRRLVVGLFGVVYARLARADDQIPEMRSGMWGWTRAGVCRTVLSDRSEGVLIACRWRMIG
mmetsp:Transcript_42109/g.98762  ORF Transcript_42109/g.98762 Transcript_42109/m.98762 type:complete len:217 (+) Transcript_42109:1133-1783(+)